VNKFSGEMAGGGRRGELEARWRKSQSKGTSLASVKFGSHERGCAGELSQGELQRLAFARVLHQAPRLAIMDEPVAAVSAEQGAHLLGLLKEAGIAVLLTGQLGCACMKYVERVIVLSGDAERRGGSDPSNEHQDFTVGLNVRRRGAEELEQPVAESGFSVNSTF